MSAATNTIDIKIAVTLADDTEAEFTVQISSELYHAAEVPELISDTMGRAGRAINRRLVAAKESK